MISLLAMLADQERTARQADQAARNQLGALASGLADQVGNLMTELALQVDLLRRDMAGQPALQQRTEAFSRLVDKGTSLSTRLEQMAAIQRHPDRWESLHEVVQRVARYLRTYRGGERLTVESRLGELAAHMVEAGAVEHALTQLLLRMAQNRSSEVRVIVRGHPSLAQPQSVVLWLSEEHDEHAVWPNAPGESAYPDQQVHLPQGMTGSARTLLLEIPVRLSS